MTLLTLVTVQIAASELRVVLFFFFFLLDIPFNITHIHHTDLPTKTNKQPSKHKQVVTRHAHVHVSPYNDSIVHEWIDGQAM